MRGRKSGLQSDVSTLARNVWAEIWTFIRKNTPIAVGAIIVAACSSIFTFSATFGSNILGYDSRISAVEVGVQQVTEANKQFRGEYRGDFAQFRDEMKADFAQFRDDFFNYVQK